jgi:hypothetical protein
MYRLPTDALQQSESRLDWRLFGRAYWRFRPRAALAQPGILTVRVLYTPGSANAEFTGELWRVRVK